MRLRLSLLVFLTCALGMFSTLWAATINVPTDYGTIQAAIDAATAGDEILVSAGTYIEHITVNKLLSITGAGSDSDPLTNTVICNPTGGDSKIGVFQFTASGLSDSSPILLQNIRINANGKAALSVGRFTEATGVNVSYLRFDNVKIYGTNVSPSTEQERGFYVDLTSSASHLVFNNCAFNNLTYGWYLQKQVSADLSSVSYVTVTNSTFIHNNHKGIYAEKLDHASFYGCTFSNNGYDATNLPTYFYDWCAGVDLNLKAGNYSEFLFDDCLITSNGTGGSKEGSGMAIKGRGTGTDTGYASFPAVVSNVTITGCTVTGNERGIRFGEPGKIINTPTNVVVENCAIHNNVKTWSGTTGSLYGDIVSLLSGPYVEVDGIPLGGSKAMWFVVPGQSIQAAINSANTGDIVQVAAGTFLEDVNISKSITLRGAGNSTIIMGPKGGDVNTIFIAADNVTVEYLAVTREGNNVADWNLGTMNNQGVLFGQGRTGCILQHCYMYGNRTGVYLNQTQGHIIRNNVIDNNRTGIQLVNDVSNNLIENNTITNNWTMGIVIYYAGVTVPTTNLIINHNNISGNWYSQVECKTNGSYVNPTTSYSLISNWFGAATLNVTTAMAGEPGYAAQIPVEFGGTSVSPGNNNGKISGDLSGLILYDMWWANPEMTIYGSNAPVENTTRNVFYQTIQAAIDDAGAGEDILVKAGTYAEALNIEGKTDLTITGQGRDVTIVKPTTVLPWNAFGYTTNRRAAIRVINSNGLVFEGLTLDCELIRNNGYYGVLYGNSTGGTFQNNTFKNFYIDTTHYYDVMFAGRTSIYTPDNYATVSILNNNFTDTGRIGILTHDYLNSTISGNTFSKTTHTFGYGMEIGSQSKATISNNTLFGFDTPAVSDNSTSGAIYIENCFTGAITEPLTKTVTLANNNVYNNQSGLTVGNQFAGYAGNVDINIIATDNTFTNNVDYALLLTDLGKSLGSSVTATLTGNTITSNLGTPGAVGLFIYGVGDSDLSVTMNDNTVSGYEYDVYVNEYGSFAGSSYVLSATGNTFASAEVGVYTGNVNWAQLRLDNPHFADNIFEDNTIHMDNSTGSEQDMETIMTNNDFVGGAYEFGQIIYSSSAEMMYVEAPSELIKDVETQVYSVKALSIEDLRAFTLQLRIPKADFDLPNSDVFDPECDFALGAAYAGYADPMLMPILFDDTDPDYYIYTISGSYMGPEDGITGNEKELLTVTLTSKLDRDNVALGGCDINLPLNQIILKDEMNANIGLIAAAGFHVIIDCTEPTLVALDEPAGQTLAIDPAKSFANGFPSVVDTSLGLTFNDNYNLDYLKFKIQSATEPTDPTIPADFSNEIAIGIADLVWDNQTWQIPDNILNAAANNLPTGSYEIWFLAVDDAGNYMTWSWTFLINKDAIEPLVWDPTNPCRTTAKQNNSIDLKWTNPAGAATNHIWAISYEDLSENTGAYPEYNPAGFTMPAIPAAPNPYNSADQNGWTRVGIVPAANTQVWTGMTRGYYYVTAFAASASGVISTVPVGTFYRESISYWPGDVDGIAPNGTNHVVTASDIAALSTAWGKADGQAGFSNIIDVGPTVDNARRSRPTPDNIINIEDLMIFAMNYNNTVYTYYPRETQTPETSPIRIDMITQMSGDQMTVRFELSNNSGWLKGLNIPMLYGTGLSLASVVSGDIWPEESLMLNTDAANRVVISASTLGSEAGIEGDGTIAILTFNVNGSDVSTELQHMIARNIDNCEIEIDGNPEETPSGNEDPEIIVPVNSYLGDNYPNPFNPTTTISFGLKEAGNVRITIFNARGQGVRSLFNGEMPAGTHSLVWNGLDNSGRPLASGVYYYRMDTKNYSQTKKSVLLK